MNENKPAGIANAAYLLFSVCLIWGGGDMIFSGLKSWREGDASTRWSIIQGRIRSASILPYEDRQRTRYRIYLRYTYHIGGATFESDQIYLNAVVTYDSMEQAREFLADYPKGVEVDVYFNPDDPRDAVLKPGRTAEGGSGVGMGVVLLMMGLFLMAKTFAGKKNRGEGIRCRGDADSR